MMITAKGQITIPVKLRDKMGFLPHTCVEFVEEGDEIKLVKAASIPERGKRLIDHLRGKGKVSLSTDQIMALTRGEP